MMNFFESRRLALLGGTAFAALALTSPALSQTVPVTPPETEGDAALPVGDPDEDQIVVTGFRAALQSAVAEKKRSDEIVESVSAEDIGKLPDNSIGESIARLPGLTSQRTSGRANVIAIRGFGPDFSQTLFNGREQTTTSDSRSVEFDQYPAEIVNQVVVYKSPNASLIGQGLVGTVDIRAIRPLEYGGRSVLAIGARGSYTDLGALNAGSEELGYRVNATFVDQFADDTFGVALAASYVDEPYQIQEFNAWGYANTQVGGADAAVIGGSKSFVTSTQLKRLGLNGTAQWQAAPNLLLTVDGFYSNFEDDQTKRGIELPLGFNAPPVSPVVEDGTVVSGTFNNVEGVVRNDVFQREADLYSFGFNAKWEGDNGWNAFADASYSRTDRRELSLESYSGTGFGAFNPDTNSDEVRDNIGFNTTETGTIFDPTLDYSDPDLIVLTDPLGWGGGTRNQSGYYNDRIVEDELKQFRAEIERELEGNAFSAVKVGINYTDRTKQLTPDEFFVQLAGGVFETRIPDEFLLEPTNLSYLGLGPIVSYDPRELLDAGVLELSPNAVRDVFAKAYTVDESLLTLYLRGDIQSDLGYAELTGNIGVQAVRTKQSSDGFIFPPGGAAFQEITLGDEYWDVLPSVNVSMRFPSDWVLRLAMSKQMQRPRLDQMRVAIGYGVDDNDGLIKGSGGNPLLRPYEAWAVDFNIEKYFANNGYVALQFFYKDLETFIYERPFLFDYTGFPLEEGDEPISNIGLLTAPTNIGGGKLYGVEAAATLPFAIFSETLDGFGITGGVSYTETEIRDPLNPPDADPTTIPGYSKWVANGTAFFEKWGFSARGSVRYRSSFLGDFTGFGGSPTRRQALPETIVDAQIGYEFGDRSSLRGLSIYLQGQNLTDERFASVVSTDSPLQVIDYQIYGRRFLAGFNYKF